MNWYDAAKWCNARSEKAGLVPAYCSDAGLTSVYRIGQANLQADWVRWNSGYRLPTEAEWEKAARGGSTGHRFPWSDADTINQSRANYYSYWVSGAPFYSFDVNSTSGYHPIYNDGMLPYTRSAESFAANGYGVCDMAGNVWEWCHEWWDGSYYSGSPLTDPRGPLTGTRRVLRGGSWNTGWAWRCRVSSRPSKSPGNADTDVGFRTVLP